VFLGAHQDDVLKHVAESGCLFGKSPESVAGALELDAGQGAVHDRDVNS
jgi:hypothetical protein